MTQKRDWDYTISGYGIGPAEREEIRKEIIKNYGEKLELIAPDKPKKKKQKAKKKKDKR